MLRLALRAAPIVAVCVLAACGGDPASPAAASVAGTYTLRSIDGVAVPVARATRVAADSDVIVSATLVLFPEHTFTERLQARFRTGGQVTSTDDTFYGQYVVTGSTVTLTYMTGGVVSATIGDGTLAATPDGRVWQYGR